MARHRPEEGGRRSARSWWGWTALSVLLLALAAGARPVRGEEKAGEGPPAKGEEKEGPIVREIEVRGNVRVDTGTVLRLIRTRIGRPFNPRVWEEDWRRLADAGYFLNVVTTPPVDWPGGVKLVIDLVEMASVKKVEFKGNGSVRASELREHIKSAEGGRYQQGQVHLDARAIERHYHDRAFRDAKVTYDVTVVSTHRQMVRGQEQEVQDEVVVTFKVDEGFPISLRTVAFSGNQAFSDSQLQAAIQSKPRRLFRAGDLKDVELDTDKKRLEHFYLRNGYMDVSVDEAVVQVGDKTYWNWFRKRKKLADVTFKIVEGPQYHVGTVTLTGNQSIELSEIQAVMKLKPGAVFSDLILGDDADRIKKLYGEYGRVFTRVETGRKLVTDSARLKDAANLFDVDLRIKEGSEVALREVITRGNTKTKDKVIIRELELFPGDRLDTSRIEIAKQRLKNLDFFEEDIRVTTEPTDNPEEANVVIDVTEKATGEFNFGVGVSSVDAIMGNVSLTQRNFDYRDWPKSWRDLISGNAFTGAGQRFSVDLMAGTKRQRYSVSLYEPWAFDRPIRLGGSLFHTQDDSYEDFSQSNTGFSLTAGRRLWGPRWDGDVTYRFAYTQIGDTDDTLPPIMRDQEGAWILSSITPRLVYDSRDSHILPAKGWMIEGSVEAGGLGGSVAWVRPTLNVARYFTAMKMANGGKHILELHGTAAMIESFMYDGETPPFLRYFGGGVGSIRGFQPRTVAPLEGGAVIGGKKSITGTVEYSVPVWEEIVRVSAFMDAGNIWDGAQPDRGYRIENESGWRVSAGVGIAIRTPLSPMPIRLYFSRPLVKNPLDRTKMFDFTFGTRF